MVDVAIIGCGVTGAAVAYHLAKKQVSVLILEAENDVSMGTTKALEMGEIEGAMSSLSIAVAGLMTVVIVPLMSGLI